MEVEALIQKMKAIYTILMEFIDANEGSEVEFQALTETFADQEILQNNDEIQILFQLISRIANNHRRSSSFLYKLDKIFQYLIKERPLPISSLIPNYNDYNNRITFLLLEKGFVKPDDQFLKKYLQSSSKKTMQSYYYLYPKIKEYLEESKQKQIENEILQKFGVDLNEFEEKCKIGENDLYICSLIREDMVEDFISYVNRTNLSLKSIIKSSIYETNSFLIDKKPTLIEYASFFGAIQIIQYLKYNQVPLTSSLWLYSVHSNNGELIHFLEENKVKPEKNSTKSKKDLYEIVLIESIKCHHNDISNYIKDSLYEPNDQSEFYDNYSVYIYDSLNFFFFPDDVKPLFSKSIKERGFRFFQLCFSLKKVTIPSTITIIGDSAFNRCSKLTQIIIPSSVTSIRQRAFAGCLSLTEITIPSSVTSIGFGAFNGCSSLNKITIPSSVTSVGDYAFSGVKELEIDGDMTVIPNNLMKGCSTLIRISIPSSIKKIGNSAFSECSSLTEITIPSSVTSIEYNTFYRCSSLSKITIPSSVTSIEYNAFYGCSSLSEITIPSSVTSLGDYTFNECFSLAVISLSSSLKSIGNYCFCCCSKLKQILIPSSVTKIGDFAFNKCIFLTDIKFEQPSSLESIGNWCFYKCFQLKQISIPSSVTSIGKLIFGECSSLNKITGIPGVDESLFNSISSQTKISFPSSASFISPYAFFNNKTLVSINIPSSVTSIGELSFYECSSLVQVTIPNSVTSIGQYAFYNCISLVEISIPSSVESIEECTFYGCKKLSGIVIPRSIKSIGNAAFYSCSALKEISIPSSVKLIGNYVFHNCSSLTGIKINDS